ncbi:solute carrier family 23 member 2-like [Haliotis rubra]|uniref:solute carrier family 23 member 2-like n=1 Tax=Haliotis rubra TaxID=36100 RepID=UPI001EE5EE1F|nr:solute carrier family 23 member 2-like [Haliotis rubra]
MADTRTAPRTSGEENSEIQLEIRQETFLYPVDKSPSLIFLPLHGLQEAIVSISGALGSAVLLANQIGAGHLTEVRSQILSLFLFTSGVASLLQVCIGCRLPVIHGPNTSYLIAIAAILNAPKWSDESLGMDGSANVTSSTNWKIRMREIQGDLMLASGVQFLLGITGILGFLLRFIGPLTVAPTVLVLGLTLCRYVIPLCEQHWGIASLSIVLVLVFSMFLAKVSIPFPGYNRKKKCHVTHYPLFQLNAVVLAIGLSWCLCHVLTVTDVLSSNSTVHGYMARTDVRTSALYNAPWFYFPLPFQFGTPTISSSGFTAMFIITIVTIIQVPGFYSATASVVELPPPPAHALNRGIAVDGISSVISGMLGGVYSSILYIQSLGVVTVTKVASRSVFVTAALILMIGGVVGKVGAVFTIIPDPVVGGVNFVAVSTVTAVGVSMLNAVDLSSSRNLLILGISLSLGLLLPDWMAANENAINTGNEVLDQLLEMLLVTPMFVTMFLGCVLDNLAPGTREERGMAKRNLEAACDTQETTDDPYRLPYISTFMDKLGCCSYFPASPTFKQVLVTCNKDKEGEHIVE